MFYLAKQLSAEDWFIYKSLETRFGDWAILLGNVFSLFRISECIMSTSRPNSNQCLYYKVSRRFASSLIKYFIS